MVSRNQPSGDGERAAATTAEPSAALVLSRAADLIEPDGAWTQGAFARPSPGDEITRRWPRKRTCWCLRGALYEVTGGHPGKAKPELMRVAERYLDASTNFSVSTMWNDQPGRTQADVVAALRKAALLAAADTTEPPIHPREGR